MFCLCNSITNLFKRFIKNADDSLLFEMEVLESLIQIVYLH